MKKKPCITNTIITTGDSTPSLNDCGVTLTSTAATITWSDPNAPSGRIYQPYINGGIAGSATTGNSVSVTGLPSDGSIIVKQIQYSDDDGVTFQVGDTCTCTAVSNVSSTPLLNDCGVTLTSTSATFTWSDPNAPAGRIYQPYVNGGVAGSATSGNSVSVTGLPSNGSTIVKQIQYSDDGGATFQIGSTCECTAVDIDVVNECIPECVRFTGINLGQPIRFFHDLSNWDPTYYAQISDANPLPYLQQAMDLWQALHPCGQLFEFVNDASLADFQIIYLAEDPATPCTVLASATCVCDDDDDVCINEFDHSQVFGPTTTLGTLSMRYVQCLQAGMSPNRWVNLYLHELGHVLGMGHVSGLPGVTSIMGVSDRFATPVLYQWDIDEFQRRYPCDCNIVQPITQFEPVPATLNQTGDFCPGCQIDPVENI